MGRSPSRGRPGSSHRLLREPAGRRSAVGPMCTAGCCSTEQPPQKQSPGPQRVRDVAFKHEFRNPHGSSRPAFLFLMSLGYFPSDCSIRKARLGVRHLLGNTRHNLYIVFNSSGWDLPLGKQLFLSQMRCSDLVRFIYLCKEHIANAVCIPVIKVVQPRSDQAAGGAWLPAHLCKESCYITSGW